MKEFFCDIQFCPHYNEKLVSNCSRILECPYKKLWNETNRKVIEIDLSNKSYAEQSKIINTYKKLYENK